MLVARRRGRMPATGAFRRLRVDVVAERSILTVSLGVVTVTAER